MEKDEDVHFTALINFAVVKPSSKYFGSIFCKSILELLGTPDNVLPDANTYLRIYFIGLPFLFFG